MPHKATVARGASERRATPASFATPESVAQEAIMEANARIERAVRTFVNEYIETRNQLRAAAQSIRKTAA